MDPKPFAALLLGPQVRVDAGIDTGITARTGDPAPDAFARSSPRIPSQDESEQRHDPVGTHQAADRHTDGPGKEGEDQEPAPILYRTIWLSDIHLGSSGCQADYLLDFLKHNESENLYLVGDIIDGWRLKKGWYWPQAHNDVVQKVLRKARKGTHVIYVPGNHDEMARQFCDIAFGDILVRDEAFHTTADGRRLWIVHGDLFDGVIQHAKWLAYLGDNLYSAILVLNRWFNRIRNKLGFGYWSLSQYLKHQVKNAVNFISAFEQVMTDEARRRGCDGVVCGHIHKAEIRDIDGVLYCNDGDWVESLSALVETFEGELKIVYWTVKHSSETTVRATSVPV
ncbi:UDP-2,3-diacylglucosamine diphosphatase [Robbsia andropogonis]|uniref:UDP-2,3-diacylglucosamine diphosphatase n=1 Tax=Robbsia andropogonis TaxID=28092 RepID=UPI0004635B9F